MHDLEIEELPNEYVELKRYGVPPHRIVLSVSEQMELLSFLNAKMSDKPAIDETPKKLKEETEVPTEEVTEAFEKRLKSMTKDELIRYAIRRDMEISINMTVEQIISEILMHDNEI